MEREKSYWRSCLIASFLFSSFAVSHADTCVKFHKRAAVPAVCGRIINVAGERLTEVELDLADENGSVLFRARSDGDGRFRFAPLPKGDYTLRVDVRGYQLVTRQLRVTKSDSERCGARIEVTLGFNTCGTGTYIKGIDKASDLDSEPK